MEKIPWKICHGMYVMEGMSWICHEGYVMEGMSWKSYHGRYVTEGM